MKTHYYLKKGGRAIQGDVLFEESALTDVVRYQKESILLLVGKYRTTSARAPPRSVRPTE